MPDMRLAKARATLPTGYQFGDADGSKLCARRRVHYFDGDGPCPCGRFIRTDYGNGLWAIKSPVYQNLIVGIK